ncbi:methyltransferase family protein [Psychromonas sp. KJ10-2]|uniref:methyltransferase family protein n=1 Tax=Psychromonas sp. KJ10-2 TaxID=3391822 RepID=UPI0039B6CEF3
MLRILRYPPVITLLYMLMMLLISYLLSSVNVHLPVLHWLALFIVIIAMLVVLSGGWAFKKANTTVDPTTPEKASVLVNTGIYRYSRNPMYLGLLGLLLAEACVLGNSLCLLVIPFYIYSMNKRFIEPEEKALMRIFGSQFEAYKNQVRRWL